MNLEVVVLFGSMNSLYQFILIHQYHRIGWKGHSIFCCSISFMCSKQRKQRSEIYVSLSSALDAFATSIRRFYSPPLTGIVFHVFSEKINSILMMNRQLNDSHFTFYWISEYLNVTCTQFQWFVYSQTFSPISFHLIFFDGQYSIISYYLFMFEGNSIHQYKESTCSTTFFLEV